MKPHTFAPQITVTVGRTVKRTLCVVCGQSESASIHLAAEDVTPQTDGAQAYRFIRGQKP